MTPSQGEPRQQDLKQHPSFGEQVVVTIKILLATGVVFGGIWLLMQSWRNSLTFVAAARLVY